MIFKIGDVSKAKIVAHCISCDCAMGAGVVVPICNQHEGLRDDCRAYAKSNERSVLGTAYRYEDENGVVYNMFTKTSVRERAGYLISYEQYLAQLENCLNDVLRQMKEHGETTLSIPLIGCGLDRCKWEDVQAIVQRVFPADISVIVHTLSAMKGVDYENGGIRSE